MPKLIVVSRDGGERVLEAGENNSVMEVVRNAGIEEMLALCGGCLSCATCHVYVDPAYIDKLPPMSSDEDALLDSTDKRRPTSRLGCQIPFGSTLDGMKVEIADEG
jgi:ferredoxin, 2Fe-2S